MIFVKRIFLLFSVCILMQASSAMNSNSNTYIVVAKLVDFIPGISSPVYSGYPIKLVIANTSYARRKFFMMSCSWQDGWKINDENFYLNSLECDSNYPVYVALAPGQEKVLYVQVIRKSDSKNKRNSELRFGFIELTDSLYWVNIKRIAMENMKDNNQAKPYCVSDKYKGATTYWSNKVILP